MQSAKLPPQNIEAEQSLLGALLIDKDSIVRISELVSPIHFYRTEQHGAIYEAIQSLFDKREPIDLVTLTEELKRKGVYDKIGGSSYLTSLVNTVPTSAHIEQYARIVKEHSVRRNLIVQATKLIENAYDESQPVAELLEYAESSLFAISQDNVKRDFIPIKDVLTESFDRLDELQKNAGKLRGVPTGFRDLDNKLAGMQNSNLIILAARPGVGKTSMAVNIAQHVAVNVNLPVGIFSLEMSQEELVDRLLVAQADIDAWKLKTGKLDEKDYDKLSLAMGALAEAPLYIDDTPGINISELRTKARRLQIEHGLRFVIVDYLQLIHGRNLENRVQEVSEISQALKNLARELKIPVLALSQLSRAVESRGTRKPQLADLRESGCLAGDTLIMRADIGELVRIKDIVGKANIPVFSVNEHNKLEVKLISRVFSSGKKQLFALKTRSGRVINASANHPFLTIEGWKRVDQLKQGEHVGIPRKLRPIRSVSHFSDNELILLAHLIGDGCVIPHQPIHYTSADQENIQIVSQVAKQLFGINSRIVKQENWFHVYLTSPYHLTKNRRHPITEWFNKLGLEKVRSYDKRLPEQLFSCSLEQIALFLHHLWATDGNISWRKMASRKKSAAIYYATTSSLLAKQVQHLLLRFGILSTLRIIPQGIYRPSYQVHIQGSQMQLTFCEVIGSYGERGKIITEIKQALDMIIPNPNLDIIPKQAWQLIIKQEKDLAKMSWRSVSAQMNTSYCGSTLFKTAISRERMLRIATAINSSKLSDLASSDVFWDEISSITPLGVEEVFDATVPGTHNFVAEDFIVHNSIEQDADVVMFLYKEDPEQPENITLDIQKHRNGSIGDIQLFFRGDRTKFYGVEKARVAKASESKAAA